MNERLKQIQILISERDKYVTDGEVMNQHKYDEHIFELNDRGHIDWMVETIKLTEENSKKLGELNVFLQNRKTGRIGDNVVDVVVDYVKELEEQTKRHKKEKYRLMKKKQRYEKALGFYADKEKVKGKVMWDNGDVARQALQGDSND